jgi:hypothetical protein
MAKILGPKIKTPNRRIKVEVCFNFIPTNVQIFACFRYLHNTQEQTCKSANNTKNQQHYLKQTRMKFLIYKIFVFYVATEFGVLDFVDIKTP